MDISAWQKQSMTALAIQVREVEQINAQLREENDRLRMRVKIFEGFHSRPVHFPGEGSHVTSPSNEHARREASRSSLTPSDFTFSNEDMSATNRLRHTGTMSDSSWHELSAALRMGDMNDCPEDDDDALTRTTELPPAISSRPDHRVHPSAAEPHTLPPAISSRPDHHVHPSAAEPHTRTATTERHTRTAKTQFQTPPVTTNVPPQETETFVTSCPEDVKPCRIRSNAGTSADAPFLLFPSQGVSITPVRAMRGSRFVDVKNGNLLIRNDAIIVDRGVCEASCKGRVVLNSVAQYPDMYVGVQYEDGTNLSYLPIRDTEVSGTPNATLVSLSGIKDMALKRGYGNRFVHVCLPQWAYDGILRTAAIEYQLLSPDVEIRDSEVIREHGLAWFSIPLTDKNSPAVFGFEEARGYKRSVAAEMCKRPRGFIADGLFVMRFRREGSTANVRFQLRSLLIHRDED